eukprot:971352-Prorocentrum_lima.AAC.1
MTSSLVGSEMCIRDSSEPLNNSGIQQQLPVGSPYSRYQKVTGKLLPLSVSYTHLTLPTICSV